MDKKLLEAFNNQITAEFYSGYLYLQMGACFEKSNLKGFASWMRVQAMEESSHAMILFNYVAERGETIELGPIEQPQQTYDSVTAIFEKTLEHEKMVTGMIGNLMNLATEAGDHASRIRLEWFVTEQVEEEASASEILDRLKLLGDNPGPALLMLDSELKARTFHVPSPLVGKI